MLIIDVKGQRNSKTKRYKLQDKFGEFWANVHKSKVTKIVPERDYRGCPHAALKKAVIFLKNEGVI